MNGGWPHRRGGIRTALLSCACPNRPRPRPRPSRPNAQKQHPPPHNSRHAQGHTLRSRSAVSLGLTMQGRTPPSKKTTPIMAAGAAMPPPPPPAAGKPAAGVSHLWLGLINELGEEEKDTNPPPAGIRRRVRRIDTRSIGQRPAMRLGDEVRLTRYFIYRFSSRQNDEMTRQPSTIDCAAGAAMPPPPHALTGMHQLAINSPSTRHQLAFDVVIRLMSGRHPADER